MQIPQWYHMWRSLISLNNYKARETSTQDRLSDNYLTWGIQCCSCVVCFYFLGTIVLLCENKSYCWSPKYFKFRSMATDAINEAFLPKRTPVTSPVCSIHKSTISTWLLKSSKLQTWLHNKPVKAFRRCHCLQRYILWGRRNNAIIHAFRLLNQCLLNICSCHSQVGTSLIKTKILNLNVCVYMSACLMCVCVCVCMCVCVCVSKRVWYVCVCVCVRTWLLQRGNPTTTTTI